MTPTPHTACFASLRRSSSLDSELGLQQAGPARVGGNGGVRKVATKQRRCLRSRMRHTVSDRLVYCHEALLLRIKRTKAGGGLVAG